MNTQRVAVMLVVSGFLGCFPISEPLIRNGDAGQTTPHLKPNLMLVIDDSGSMTDTITGGGTRIDALKSAANAVLTDLGSTARFGLAVFPENGGATQSIRVELPAAATTDDSAVLQAKATEVNGAIQALTPSGGTPTAASIAFVGTDPGLNAADHRADFIVLITDGLPNLNAANPNAVCGCAPNCTQTQMDACACTQSPVSSCNQTSGNLCAIGCLDEDATVASINSLRANQQIVTFVVSYGDEVSTNQAKTVMNSMAAAGGSSTTYQAGTLAELQQALRDIIGQIAASADGGT